MSTAPATASPLAPALTRLEAVGTPPRLALRFTNRTAQPLWLPRELVPAHREDAAARLLTVRYGYFEEVYGPYRDRYVLPPFERVAPGETLQWEVTDRELLARASRPGWGVAVWVRVATREFTPTRVRGEQPLDAYLLDSFVAGVEVVAPSP